MARENVARRTHTRGGIRPGEAMHIQPGGMPGFGTDKYADMAVDATYQFLGDGTNVVSFYTIFTHENRQLDASLAQGLAAYRHGHLD